MQCFSWLCSFWVSMVAVAMPLRRLSTPTITLMLIQFTWQVPSTGMISYLSLTFVHVTGNVKLAHWLLCHGNRTTEMPQQHCMRFIVAKRHAFLVSDGNYWVGLLQLVLHTAHFSQQMHLVWFSLKACFSRWQTW